MANFILFLLAVPAIYVLLVLSGFKLILSDGFQKFWKWGSQLGPRAKRALKGFTGEPQEGTTEYALKYYGLESEAEYRKERSKNRESIRMWVDGLRRRGYEVAWHFVDVFIDRIEIDYNGSRYTAEIFFEDHLDGTRTVKGCTAASEKEVIQIEGAKLQRPGFDVTGTLATDESFKYLQKVKEEVLKNGEAHLDVSRLLCLEDFESLTEEVSLKDYEKVYEVLEANFYTYTNEGCGIYTVYGLNEEL